MNAVLRHAATGRQMGGVSSIAAPLLAAAALTVVGVIVQDPDKLALPVPALAALSVAAAALVTSVNASIWASYYNAEPPGSYRVSTSTPPMSREEFQHAVAVYNSYGFWVNVTRRTYLTGVYALWVGLALALIPDPFSGWRVVAIVPVVAAAVVEATLFRFAPKAEQEPTYWAIRDRDDDLTQPAVQVPVVAQREPESPLETAGDGSAH